MDMMDNCCNVEMRNTKSKKDTKLNSFAARDYLGGIIHSVLFTSLMKPKLLFNVVKINISKIRRKEITRKDLCK
jgi:predicted membrane-bound spermidine synthase